ncbi:MAG: transposase [Chthoniobacter sp.]
MRHNAPQIENLHGLLITLSGGPDATQLPGISPLGFMKLIGETGTDLSRWKSAKHFTSWLGLSPGSAQSGKRRRRLPRKKTVAGQIFREAVLSIAKSKHLALGGRLSPAQSGQRQPHCRPGHRPQTGRALLQPLHQGPRLCRRGRPAIPGKIPPANPALSGKNR